MDVLRNRLATAVAALAFAFVVPACGDDDDKGAVEEIEKGAEEAKDRIEKEGKELRDDVEGKDGKELKDDIEGKGKELKDDVEGKGKELKDDVENR